MNMRDVAPEHRHPQLRLRRRARGGVVRRVQRGPAAAGSAELACEPNRRTPGQPRGVAPCGPEPRAWPTTERILWPQLEVAW